MMLMMYLVFVLSIFFIRILSGYDSRYQKGKYICIKNTVLSVILLDTIGYIYADALNGRFNGVVIL